MQLSKFAILLILGQASALSLETGTATAARAAAQAAARSWLQTHRAAQPDELAELKAENPQAYAIVKALLTKRALGLLDPKHPSASFAAPASHQIAAAEPAVAAVPATVEAVVTSDDVVPAPAPAPARQDWFNWRPQQTAVDDEQMVSSVLGSAESTKQPSSSSRTLLSRGRDATEVSAAAASQQNVAQENPYLNALGMDTEVSSSVSTKKSSNNGVSHNYLASFTWQGDTTSAQRSIPQQKASEQVSNGNTNKPHNALLSWLGGNKQTSQETGNTSNQKSSTQQQQEENPYLAALQ